MEWLTAAAPWLALFLLAAVALILLRRQVRGLLALVARTGIGLAVLACLNTLGGLIGVTLGVNLANALVLAVLGAPGLGLLLMVQWMLRA